MPRDGAIIFSDLIGKLDVVAVAKRKRVSRRSTCCGNGPQLRGWKSPLSASSSELSRPLAGEWASETADEHAEERRRKRRYWISVVLIFIGTVLQIPANLPH